MSYEPLAHLGLENIPHKFGTEIRVLFQGLVDHHHCHLCPPFPVPHFLYYKYRFFRENDFLPDPHCLYHKYRFFSENDFLP